MFIIIGGTLRKRILAALICDPGLHKGTCHVVPIFITQIESATSLKLNQLNKLKASYRWT